MSHTDTFWKLFWMVVGVLAALYFAVVIGLVYFYNPTKTADAAAVGLVFDQDRDPFAGKRPNDARPKFTGEYFYEDALPLAFADWSWSVHNEWNSRDRVFEGTHSLKIQFLQDWSGMRAQASDIDVSSYKGISFAVYPSSNGDLYFEVFDTYGNSLGKQSISWYMDGGKLSANSWNFVTIPFENLFPPGQNVRAITGYAISTVHPEIAYVDSIHLETEAAAHPRWVEPQPEVAAPELPAEPIALPYELKFTPDGVKQWRTVFGKFDLTANGVRIGTISEKTTGSMSYIRGGQNWSDYHVDTSTYWGQTSSFSILLRYVDDANFISCAFSNYNAVAQLYQVKKGVSTLLGASPGLPIRSYEPWKDANAGASVQGDRVTCYVDGASALSYEIPDISPAGSAGIETWTQNTYDSPHTLQKFTVTAL